MRSLKVGVVVSLGVPFCVAVLILLLASPDGGESFWDLASVGVFLWILTAAAVLATAAPRVALGRRIGAWPLDHERAWRQRLRTTFREGSKVVVVFLTGFGLVIWTNHSYVSNTPADHDVRISLPPGARTLGVEVRDPRPGDCPTRGTIDLFYSGPGAPQVAVRGEPVEPRAVRDRGRSSYAVPLRSERTTYSCYLDFPKVVSASGAVPVDLEMRAIGSGSDSTPAPTRYQDGHWGWRCRGLPTGEGCAVLGVANADPTSAAPTLAVLVAGAAFAAVIALLISAFKGLWRGWVDDLTAIWRLLSRRARQLLAELGSEP